MAPNDILKSISILIFDTTSRLSFDKRPSFDMCVNFVRDMIEEGGNWAFENLDNFANLPPSTSANINLDPNANGFIKPNNPQERLDPRLQSQKPVAVPVTSTPSAKITTNLFEKTSINFDNTFFFTTRLG